MTLTDIPYASASHANVLDVHLPRGPGPFPFAIDIHGGAFRSGDKRDLPVPRPVLDRGIAVVRVNYRLSGEARWPAQLEDVLAAVDYLNAHAGDLGLVARCFALSGQSAGGFLAVMAALESTRAGRPPRAVVDFYGPIDFGAMDADMAALGRTPRFGWTDAPGSPESMLLGWAVGDDRVAATAAGPIGVLAALPTGTSLPPLVIRHGDADAFIAHTQSERLRDAWRRVYPDGELDFAILPGTGHGRGAFDDDAVPGDLAAFLARHLR